jgi:CheY-like chemotaxis protein
MKSDAPKPVSRSSRPPSPKRGRLLIVDDDPDTARVLAHTLEHEWEVVVADDGVTGLEAALQLPHPDVILADITMPRLDGIEMVRSLRRALPWPRIPVIFLTALGGSAITAAAIEAGARYFVSKPVSLPGLEQKLRLALGRPSFPPQRRAAS